MKSSRRNYPEINAGSTADIAFLLLIFFLVTAVIPNDSGINRKLAPLCPDGIDCSNDTVEMRNILEIKINAKDELLINNQVASIITLKDITKEFLSNNGDGSCDYCDGLKHNTSSESPKKAVVSLSNDSSTSYNFYINVQDQITKAYYELRSDYALKILNKSSNELTLEELKKVRKAYPFNLSETQIKD
jgi:biopolymer transport protein ExbD